MMQEPQLSDDSYNRAKKRAAELAGYWTHLSAFVIIIGVLILINLITWGGYFWAIWPAMGWGIGLLFQTFATFGRRLDKDWQERKARELIAREQGGRPARYGEGRLRAPFSGGAATDPATGPSSPATVAQLTDLAGEEIDRLRRVSRQIPTPDVRRQALEVLAAADQIVAALGDGEGDETMARTFLDRYLGPTGTILVRYQRLATRDIDAARPALRRVEEHDLPLLNRRMNELRGQLHQGDLIDLEVASEMLAFELDEPDASGPSLVEGPGKPDPVPVRRSTTPTR